MPALLCKSRMPRMPSTGVNEPSHALVAYGIRTLFPRPLAIWENTISRSEGISTQTSPCTLGGSCRAKKRNSPAARVTISLATYWCVCALRILTIEAMWDQRGAQLMSTSCLGLNVTYSCLRQSQCPNKLLETFQPTDHTNSTDFV